MILILYSGPQDRNSKIRGDLGPQTPPWHLFSLCEKSRWSSPKRRFSARLVSFTCDVTSGQWKLDAVSLPIKAKAMVLQANGGYNANSFKRHFRSSSFAPSFEAPSYHP